VHHVWRQGHAQRRARLQRRRLLRLRLSLGSGSRQQLLLLRSQGRAATAARELWRATAVVAAISSRASTVRRCHAAGVITIAAGRPQ
jgi:hypothetical protein